MLIAQERFEEAKTQLDAARLGFDELLGRHLLAFADQAAEFYAGSGNDCQRAFELARVEVANRQTRLDDRAGGRDRRFSLAMEIFAFTFGETFARRTAGRSQMDKLNMSDDMPSVAKGDDAIRFETIAVRKESAVLVAESAPRMWRWSRAK